MRRVLSLPSGHPSSTSTGALSAGGSRVLGVSRASEIRGALGTRVQAQHPNRGLDGEFVMLTRKARRQSFDESRGKRRQGSPDEHAQECRIARWLSTREIGRGHCSQHEIEIRGSAERPQQWRVSAGTFAEPKCPSEIGKCYFDIFSLLVEVIVQESDEPRRRRAEHGKPEGLDV